MNARIARLALALAVSVSLAQCNEIAYPAKFTVKVMDEEGNPVPDTEVSARTFLRWQAGEGFGKDIADYRSEQTDKTGHAVFEHPSKRGTFSIDVKQSELFYRTKTIHHKFEEVRGLHWKPENPTIPYVLKKKRNPVALYAKRMWASRPYIEFPVINQFIGFDFELGDWVEPYGKGKVEDFSVQLSREYTDIYNHDCTISIRFPNRDDGFVLVPKSLEGGSELRLDYLAPENGYRNDILKKSLIRKNKEIIDKNAIDPEANYFLRLRSKEDEEGNLIEAHYAKVHGDFTFDVINSKTGLLGFNYYFNPTPNDRNLEFDPKKNLFPNERVISP